MDPNCFMLKQDEATCLRIISQPHLTTQQMMEGLKMAPAFSKPMKSKNLAQLAMDCSSAFHWNTTANKRKQILDPVPYQNQAPDSETRLKKQNLVPELVNRNSATGVRDSGVPKYGAGIWY